MADGVCEHHHQENTARSMRASSATDSRVNQMLADGDADGDGEVTLVRIAHLLACCIHRETATEGQTQKREEREERVEERKRDIHFCMLIPDCCVLYSRERDRGTGKERKEREERVEERNRDIYFCMIIPYGGP